MHQHGKSARDEVPARVALFLRLHQEIGVPGKENIGFHNFAQIGRQLRAMLEFLYFFGGGVAPRTRHDHARIQNRERNRVRDRGEILKRLGGHAARDQRAVNKNAERKMRGNRGLAVQRRSIRRAGRESQSGRPYKWLCGGRFVSLRRL